MAVEKTLVLIKPDGVKRNLTGEIIKRFEDAGLKLVALKMLAADEQLISKHYPMDREYLVSLGKKSEKAGDRIADYEAQGRMIVEGLRKYLTSGPVIAMVLKGDDAINRVRKITGYTDPVKAEPGTIRGDFGEDSIIEANREKRACRNLIHASGNPEEAEKEIRLWFRDDEILE
jgi:nucleoside-diphosphate kinase